VSFSRHGKIYQSDGLEGKLNWPSNLPTDHRSDESSTGYSFMSCSPAEPMSASPVLHSFSRNLAAVQSSAANRKLSPFLLSQHRGPLQDVAGVLCFRQHVVVGDSGQHPVALSLVYLVYRTG
jgi:hypothetical protein